MSEDKKTWKFEKKLSIDCGLLVVKMFGTAGGGEGKVDGIRLRHLS